MNTQRISAIFEKDLKDYSKNMMLLMMPIIPVLLALFYSNMGGQDGVSADESLPIEMLYLIVGATFSAVTSSSMMTMIAEENEKKTFRGLMLSPASFQDIIIGKSLVVGLITLISLVVSLVISDIEPFLSVQAILGLVLLFLFFLFLGIGIGLFTKTIAETSAYLMPIMFLFGFTPMIEFFNLKVDGIVMTIFDYFPIMQLIEMHKSNTWFPLIIVLIWVLGAALFTYVCFNKSKTDD